MMRAATKSARLGALVAAMVIAGCADMSGIGAHSTLRSSESLGLSAAPATAFAPGTEW